MDFLLIGIVDEQLLLLKINKLLLVFDYFKMHKQQTEKKGEFNGN